jgi:phosphoglycerate dehydrogenase-like enzyme
MISSEGCSVTAAEFRSPIVGRPPVVPASRPSAHALVPRVALQAITQRAPDARVEAIEDHDDFGGASFIVPVPYRQADLVEVIDDLEQLRVVQTLSAGVDRLADVVPAQVTLCSARGARDSAVAEWVLGALLGASSRVAECARTRRWQERTPLRDVAESTVLILGMGSIGRAVADRLAPFGAEVIGVASHARDDLHGVDELPTLLPDADTVVVLTPLTGDTRGLIGAEALAAMRDGALLINAGRGPVVDTDALLAETQSDRLRAVLDVTDPEPLPDDHPLWSAPGVISITPHIGGNSPRANRLAAELAGDQLARWCAGEPLRNVVHQGES